VIDKVTMDRRDISASSPVRKQGPGTLEHGCNESHFSRVSGWRRGCYLSMEVRLSVGVCAGRSLNAAMPVAARPRPELA
jgi:hypothetical protein